MTYYNSSGAVIGGPISRGANRTTTTCPVGSYWENGVCTATPTTTWEPITTQGVEDKLTAKLDEWCQADLNGGVTNGKCAGLFKEGLDHDLRYGADDPTIETVSSPSTGCSTQKITSPDGSYVLRTTCVEETMTPDGNGVDLKKKTTEKNETYNPQGTKLGEETTTTEDTQPDTRDRCQKDPSLAECNLDIPSENIPKATRNVTYAAEDLGFGSGQCPPPYTWTDSLGTHAIDLSSYCDKVTTIVKPLVLAFAALSCLFILSPAKPE
jgi:hypothetical protein